MTKTIAAPKTPFPDQLPWPVPAWPARACAQAIVTRAERAAAENLLEAYRTLEILSAEHDINAISEQIASFERERLFVQAEAARRQRERCKHEVYVDSQAKMHALREHAANASITILKRLYNTMDNELMAFASAREESMTRLGIPLFTDHRVGTDMSMVVNGTAHSMSPVARDWALITDAEAQVYWVSRNCVRHLLGMFTGGVGGFTAREVRHARGVVTLAYLCTDQPCSGFSWV